MSVVVVENDVVTVVSDVGPRGYQGFQGLQGHQGFIGSQGLQGFQGVNGAQGLQGNQGDQGRASGIKYTFSTNTTDSDPGTGTLKFDTATTGNVNRVNLSKTDAEGGSVGGYL